MRGDEPFCFQEKTVLKYVCPTCVGMNRLLKPSMMCCRSLPHMRGDEPDERIELVCEGMSLPHMRGDEPLTDELNILIIRSAPHAWG